MVDRITNDNNLIQDPSLLRAGSQGQVERINKEAVKDAAQVDSLEGFDKATISDEALQAYNQEKEILKFSRLAQRVPAEVDYEKVNRIKNLLDSGRINDYLRSLDSGALADSIINSPSGAFLR